MTTTTFVQEIILQGVTGSVAYGLATESSDIDRHDVFLARNHDLLGLFPPPETIESPEIAEVRNAPCR